MGLTTLQTHQDPILLTHGSAFERGLGFRLPAAPAEGSGSRSVTQQALSVTQQALSVNQVGFGPPRRIPRAAGCRCR
jgi:hypothetical protein